MKGQVAEALIRDSLTGRALTGPPTRPEGRFKIYNSYYRIVLLKAFILGRTKMFLIFLLCKIICNTMLYKILQWLRTYSIPGDINWFRSHTGKYLI